MRGSGRPGGLHPGTRYRRDAQTVREPLYQDRPVLLGRKLGRFSMRIPPFIADIDSKVTSRLPNFVLTMSEEMRERSSCGAIATSRTRPAAPDGSYTVAPSSSLRARVVILLENNPTQGQFGISFTVSDVASGFGLRASCFGLSASGFRLQASDEQVDRSGSVSAGSMSERVSTITQTSGRT